MTQNITFYDPALGQRSVGFPSALPGGLPSSILGGAGTVGFFNLYGTTDPGASNDITTGVSVGSIWFNATAGQLRWWECRDNTAGAAKWVFSGADYTNGGTNPSTEVTIFGSSTGAMAAEGNLNRQIVAAGVQPASTGSDIVLAVYSLPANAFDVLGRGLTITAAGSLAANTNTKTIKLIFNATTAVVGSAVTGGTAICTSGLVTTAAAGGGWQAQGSVFKYGAAGSNTQLCIHDQFQSGNALGAMIGPSLTTAVESSPILIAITGNAATTASDIIFNWLEVNAMN